MGTQCISVRKCQDGTYEVTEEDGTVHSELTSAEAADFVDESERSFLEEFEALKSGEDTVQFDDVYNGHDEDEEDEED